MGDFDEFDAFADEHPELETHEAFAQWLAGETRDAVIGREVDGDGLVVALPEEEPRG